MALNGILISADVRA